MASWLMKREVAGEGMYLKILFKILIFIFNQPFVFTDTDVVFVSRTFANRLLSSVGMSLSQLSWLSISIVSTYWRSIFPSLFPSSFLVFGDK